MAKPIEIDIIILSYAKDESLKDLTNQTIQTVLASENPDEIHFNVVVIESNKGLFPYQFPNSTTIYPKEKFGFHKYLNIGIGQTNSPYVCLCNNDLVFHKGWASAMLKAMDEDANLLSAHPYQPGYIKNKNHTGEDCELDSFYGVLFGWCIFVKRELFNITGPLDEQLTFWYSDYDYIKTLQKHQIITRLIPGSIVDHLGSRSWVTMDKKEHQKLTQIPRLYFSYKWHHRSYIRYRIELTYYKLKMLLGL
ncbi:glycosyltransferase family 2 protein [Mucilaginibacter mali]|uniref:Glycosyltransferase family 2 protein n=1 Tax=Mucilaginibacter mali TaxID=2740462 RepID=A0A7D4TXJ8_9SPHI|nr:glycosyltransferase [Mucilaginibacter mali]QKJ30437.1 glycosyltransferase family 2 protein [Mucilaginibacter mali]